jgi:hypothetical protein
MVNRIAGNRQPPLVAGWGIFNRRNGEFSTGVDNNQSCLKLIVALMDQIGHGADPAVTALVDAYVDEMIPLQIVREVLEHLRNTRVQVVAPLRSALKSKSSARRLKAIPLVRYVNNAALQELWDDLDYLENSDSDPNVRQKARGFIDVIKRQQ